LRELEKSEIIDESSEKDQLPIWNDAWRETCLYPGIREIYGMYVETAGFMAVRQRRSSAGMSVPEVAFAQIPFA
jgi:hypothetical protein